MLDLESELRIGLGCMRMSTDDERDEKLSLETIAAAEDAGVTVFDTARAYGRDSGDLGHNERLLARALRSCGAAGRARIVTKGGMTRAGGGWIPDGRAKAIRADCEASLAALDGLPIDVYLVHAPDPRTPWPTTVRALTRLADERLVRGVGLSNVTRQQLDEAVELAHVAAVEVALSVYDDRALRGGIVERCTEAGIALIAHSPLGGPRRAGGLARSEALSEIAHARDATAAEVALAWLLELSPVVVAIPGARRPETARSAARAATLRLEAGQRAELEHSFDIAQPVRATRPRRSSQGEVVVVIGIPGAGKSRIAEDFVSRGYVRLNRDERGGSLREIARALDDELAAGVRRIVLDNTYLSRAARSYVVGTANKHLVPVRCIWVDTPLAQSQVNVVERLLERFGSLPTPAELRALSREPGVLTPTSQMRARRELEPPSTDEGLARVERVPFVRVWPSARSGTGVFVAASALSASGWEQALDQGDKESPHLVFDWRPDAQPNVLDACVAKLSTEVSGHAEGALCAHPAGPPRCWCRPPLPGLPLVFARAHEIDPSRSVLIGSAPAHRTLATTLGARYVPVGAPSP